MFVVDKPYRGKSNFFALSPLLNKSSMKPNKSKLTCVFETEDGVEAEKQYYFYNTTKKNTRLTKKGKLYRVWVAKN